MDNTENTQTNDMAQEAKWNQLVKDVETPKLELSQVNQPAGDLSQWQFLKSTPVLNAAKAVDDLINQLKSMNVQGFNTQTKLQVQSKGVEQILSDWKSNYMAYAQTNLNQLNSIIESLAAPKNYTDPQQEILARQDVDQRLSLIDTPDLAQYILSRLNGVDPSLPAVTRYEFNQFLVESKKMNIDDRGKVVSALESYKEANFEPWLQDNSWLSYASKVRELQVIQALYGANRVWLIDKSTSSWFQYDGGALNQLISEEVNG